ncbi:hypothetical protein D0865_08957 [Hortaea werneckii]|uniref:DUF6536 domain-containing protein n=1 Tax=Hortaea werneckii TaxID=91943 RepID=A0A3M7C4I8_HORWE|nr:hypothetical protein D0865_08957 [Hortaea werneckii]
MAAAYSVDPSPLHPPDLRADFEVNEYELQLSSVPRSQAPSYVPKSSFWNGEEQADEAFLPRNRWASSDGVKDGQTISQTVNETSAGTSSRKKRRKLQGWRFGVAVSACTAFIVLLLNMILTVYTGVTFGSSGGIGTAYEGDCERVNVWTAWLHLLINALSSILLSASNYTMQCLCSPTRIEIDRAHARGDWLDVGVPSFRNLWRINWRRTALWWILALSSVPIHLLYNSVIFKTQAANDYVLVVANTEFFKGEAFAPFYLDLYSVAVFRKYKDEGKLEASTPTRDFPVDLTDNDVSAIRDVQLQFSEDNNYANETKVHNLTASECITAYGTYFVSEHRNVVTITSARGNQTNNTVLFAARTNSDLEHGFQSLTYGWICLDAGHNIEVDNVRSCDIGPVQKNSSNWTINQLKIDYCLAEVAQPRCKLQFSLPMLATVILMNACKSICMFLTLWKHRSATLVTIGDALSSFLEQPDELTKSRCLMGKVDLRRGPMHWRMLSWYGPTPRPNIKPDPVTFRAPLRRRWFAAASFKRWFLTMGLCLAALGTSIHFEVLGLGRMASYTKVSLALNTGFGAVDSRALLDAGLPRLGSESLVPSLLLANLPQAIVSFLYLAYNGLFTCMCLAHEYSKYGLPDRKKALRVTSPRGQQRSTYYLQLPFRYAAPLLLASTTLHWLISQGIFLARISTTDYKGQGNSAHDFSEVGYSCLPILLAMLLGTAMLAAIVGCGFRKFASHIPVAGSCSVALAAAAHRPKDDVDAAFLPVQWGEVRREGTDKVGHCCFTSHEVHDLIPGRLYAGTARKSYHDSSDD